jgi:tetrathionate reductase subunit B
MTTTKWGMSIDLERCIGCHACSVACKVEHSVPLGNFRTKVYYHDSGVFPDTKRSFLPTLCMHCADAPCAKACPTTSITRGDDGIVRVDQDTCLTRGKCVSACPYGAIFVDPVSNIADKCNFCENRLEIGMQPACVEACPAGVLVFGDLNDPNSMVSLFNARNNKQLTVLKPDKETDPQVHYRGLKRELEKKVAEGHNHDPLSYEVDTWASLESTFSRKAEDGSEK